MALEAGQNDGTGQHKLAKALMRLTRACGARGRLGLAAMALVAAQACTPIYENHGYIPDERDLAEIKTGVDTRDSVAAFLGRPSAEGLIGDVEWFYVQSRWKTVGAHAPRELSRQVVAISFNPDGKVTNIERFGLEKGEVVTISRRITSEPIKGRSVLAQIFSNFGRVNASDLIGSK